MPTSGVIRYTRLRRPASPSARLPRTGQSIHLSTLAVVQARNRLRKPVSVTYRTGLRYAETEIGKSNGTRRGARLEVYLNSPGAWLSWRSRAVHSTFIDFARSLQM